MVIYQTINRQTCYLFLFKEGATSKSQFVEIVNGGLDGTSAGLHGSHKILLGHASGAEHVAVGKVLSGDVADRELGQDDLKNK
jgi:hypothetical protein